MKLYKFRALEIPKDFTIDYDKKIAKFNHSANIKDKNKIYSDKSF